MHQLPVLSEMREPEISSPLYFSASWTMLHAVCWNIPITYGLLKKKKTTTFVIINIHKHSDSWTLKEPVWREGPGVHHIIEKWYHSFYLCNTGVRGWTDMFPLFCFCLFFSFPMFIYLWSGYFSFLFRFHLNLKPLEMLSLVWIMYKMLWEAELHGKTEPVCAVAVASRH